VRLPVLLWIDLNLKTQSVDSGIGAGLSAVGRLHRCSTPRDIHTMIGDIRPDVLCFDYDFPDKYGLSILRDTRRRYPSLPILMFSEETSSELAIWALRSRVWDYFTKPVGVKEISTRLNMLKHIAEQQLKRRSRDVYMPEAIIPDESWPSPGAERETPIQLVMKYAVQHLHERVSLTTAARLCNMGTYEFSRAFKREQGITFRDFLVRLSVHEAAALLANSRISVLDVAFTVGFNDPSHFARVFRRHFGVTPSAYRTSRSKRECISTRLAGIPVESSGRLRPVGPELLPP